MSQGTLQLTVSATGPITNRQCATQLPKHGKLSEVLVSVGQTVTAGQVLARQDTTDLRIALGQAQASLPSSKPTWRPSRQARPRSRRRWRTHRSMRLKRPSTMPRRACRQPRPAPTRPWRRLEPTWARRRSRWHPPRRACPTPRRRQQPHCRPTRPRSATRSRSIKTSCRPFRAMGAGRGVPEAGPACRAERPEVLDDARASLAATQAALDSSARTDALSVQTAQQSLSDAQTSLSSTQREMAASDQADKVATDNAQRNLSNAQAARNNAQDVAAASNNVASAQVDQTKSSPTATGASVTTSQRQQDLTARRTTRRWPTPSERDPGAKRAEHRSGPGHRQPNQATRARSSRLSSRSPRPKAASRRRRPNCRPTLPRTSRACFPRSNR